MNIKLEKSLQSIVISDNDLKELKLRIPIALALREKQRKNNINDFEIANILGHSEEQIRKIKNCATEIELYDISKIEFFEDSLNEFKGNLSVKVCDLLWSTRTYNFLRKLAAERFKVNYEDLTLKDITTLSRNDIMIVRNAGVKTAYEVTEKLKYYNLNLKLSEQ
ncbi:hypothetical protein [Abyssalbus ytuae]|uniref:Uncharacterized protein n=1 Tax=Abyssalbus ytuae TaxID=2926907 RepID=A0A9E6ZTI6_9FLAO|nr:hypothetical protein [Abyssalbus ytuae]UOB18603.1 hypothetical protein MQE35_04765 [Abyssalbus ytuae]